MSCFQGHYFGLKCSSSCSALILFFCWGIGWFFPFILRLENGYNGCPNRSESSQGQFCWITFFFQYSWTLSGFSLILSKRKLSYNLDTWTLYYEILGPVEIPWEMWVLFVLAGDEAVGTAPSPFTSGSWHQFRFQNLGYTVHICISCVPRRKLSRTW